MISMQKDTAALENIEKMKQEQQRLDEEKKKMEEEKRQIEEERRKAQEDKIRAAEEKKKMEEDAIKMQAELEELRKTKDKVVKEYVSLPPPKLDEQEEKQVNDLLLQLGVDAKDKKEMRANQSTVELINKLMIAKKAQPAGAAPSPVDTTLAGQNRMRKFVTKKLGYPLEKHVYSTEDGYLNTVFRIPGKKKMDPALTDQDPTRPVVIYQHGIMDSAAGIIAAGEDSLGIRLVNAGCDLWLNNSRGNRFSRDHMKIDLDKCSKEELEAYYSYSFQEMGEFDQPALWRYVLNHTGAK